MAKYKSKTETGECIFCKIIDGTLKTPGIFWEDDDFMAFLSIYPNTEGVTVLIPKKHYDSDVLSLPDNILKKMIIASKIVSKKIQNYFIDVGRVGLIMEGTGIDHAHIKLYPMHGTDHMKKGGWKQYLSNVNTFSKKYNGYLSSHDGPLSNNQKIANLAEKLKKA